MTLSQFSDTHCHLNYHNFKEDLPEVIHRALQAQVRKIMIPGFNLASCRDAVSISEQYQSCYAAVGIHPNDAQEWDNEAEQILRKLLQHPRVLALGEIGLDYYRDHASPEMQQEALKSQLALAKEFNKPVIIHIRDSVADTFRALFTWQENLKKEKHPLGEHPGIFHAFPGTLAEGILATAHHFKIGIGGPVTFKNAKQKHQLVAEMSMQDIVLETDAPFLTPHPHRGQRNEPSYIPLIAQKIADLKNIPITEVAEVCNQNAQDIFNW